jgi:hypothetical protein
MPRICTICSHEARKEIEKAMVPSGSIRGIARRFAVSEDALSRHKAHLSGAIVKAADRREERLGDNLLEEMRRVQRKAWELLAKTENDGDHRGAIVALREVRECLESLGQMLSRAAEASPAEPPKMRVEIVHIGGMPGSEWQELPESWTALLPGHLEGTLCLRREHRAEVGRTKDGADTANFRSLDCDVSR